MTVSTFGDSVAGVYAVRRSYPEAVVARLNLATER